ATGSRSTYSLPSRDYLTLSSCPFSMDSSTPLPSNLSFPIAPASKPCSTSNPLSLARNPHLALSPPPLPPSFPQTAVPIYSTCPPWLPRFPIPATSPSPSSTVSDPSSQNRTRTPLVLFISARQARMSSTPPSSSKFASPQTRFFLSSILSVTR